MIKPVKVYRITSLIDFYRVYHQLSTDAKIKFDLIRNKQFSSMKILKKAVEEILAADTKTWSVVEVPTCGYQYDSFIQVLQEDI